MSRSRTQVFGVVFGLMAAGAFVSWLGACGPSVQFIYEGNIRFEHCYRLDFDGNIAPSHRKACWEDWLVRFPRGQTRDRLEYARRRIDLLAAGERAPLTLQVSAPGDAGVWLGSGEPVPSPMNAHSPPPARIAPPQAVDSAPAPSAVPSASAAQETSARPGASSLPAAPPKKH